MAVIGDILERDVVIRFGHGEGGSHGAEECCKDEGC